VYKIRMKNFVRFLKWFALLVLLGMILVYGGFRLYMFLNGSDEALRDDSHLFPVVPVVSDSENAFSDLERAQDSLVLPAAIVGAQDLEPLYAGAAWDQQAADQLLGQNERALQFFDSALEKEYFLLPALQSSEEIAQYDSYTTMPDLRSQRVLVAVSLVRIRDLFEGGDFDEGFDRLNAQIDFLSIERYSPLFNYLLKISLQKMTLAMIDAVFRQEEIYKSNAIELQGSLEGFKDNSNDLATAMQFEYLGFRSAFLTRDFDTLVGSDVSDDDRFTKASQFYFKPNVTINTYLIPDLEENLALASQDCVAFGSVNTRSTDRNLLHSTPVPNSLRSLRENILGQTIVDIISVGHGALHEQRCEMQYRTIATQIALGANAFKRDRGAFPDSIDMMIREGYIAVDIPEKVYQWDVVYDKGSGMIDVSENF